MKMLLAIIITVCIGVMASLIVYMLGFSGYYAGYTTVGIITGITGMATQEIFKEK